MRQDIPSGFRGIARDHQALVDTKIDQDHDHEGEQVSKSRDSCRGALGLVDSADHHFVSS